MCAFGTPVRSSPKRAVVGRGGGAVGPRVWGLAGPFGRWWAPCARGQCVASAVVAPARPPLPPVAPDPLYQRISWALWPHRFPDSLDVGGL